MRNKQNIYKRFSFKLCINALSIFVLSLMLLPIHAEEKATADSKAKAAMAAAISAAMSAVPRASNNKSNKPEVVVEEIPADIKTAVEKELLSKIEIKRPEMSDAASQVFRSPTYKVKPILGYIAIVAGEVLDLNNPHTNTRLPDYLKLIRDDFVLDSEDKAIVLANAFQPVFPYKIDKMIRPVKVKHGWIVFRGNFFKKYSGLVFTTNEKGKITLVDYVLKIDPKDYSYKPSPE